MSIGMPPAMPIGRRRAELMQGCNAAAVKAAYCRIRRTLF
jgi:hypothetical protein